MSKDELKETVSDKDKEKSSEPPSKALPEIVEEVSKIVPASETPVSETGGKDVDAGENSATKEKKEETAKDLLGTDIEEVKVRKAKGSKNVTSGICHVIATFNNTKVSFSDLKGNVISWSSSGKCNFRGSRKSTAYAAQVVTQDAGRVAMSHGMKELIVKIKGPGMGRDSAVRSLQSLGFKVSSIIDVTPVPHNGCRAPKRRRV
ncbi:MAG: 30S ribosomal protein S11 [Verrucomicrobia bacterium]|jgi:small subunit ribosomal protein S11|nr:30S ribosomal protein S11 [Verrucomicrobiota bacterium]MDA1045518.1 30S ribosomal protein S11 [Verrucomicrobiota bacterium]